LEDPWKKNREEGGGQEAGQGQRSRDFYFWEIFIWILFFLNFLKLIAELIWICSFLQEAGRDAGVFGTSLSRTEIIIAGVRTHRD